MESKDERARERAGDKPTTWRLRVGSATVEVDAQGRPVRTDSPGPSLRGLRRVLRDAFRGPRPPGEGQGEG